MSFDEFFSHLKARLYRKVYYNLFLKHYRKYKDAKLSDEEFFKQQHKRIFSYTPDFKNPQTFNEKMIHRILYDRNPIYTALADKLKARIYIAMKLHNYSPAKALIGGGGGQ